MISLCLSVSNSKEPQSLIVLSRLWSTTVGSIQSIETKLCWLEKNICLMSVKTPARVSPLRSAQVYFFVLAPGFQQPEWFFFKSFLFLWTSVVRLHLKQFFQLRVEMKMFAKSNDHWPCLKSSDKCGKVPQREWGCARWSVSTLASRSSCTVQSPKTIFWQRWLVWSSAWSHPLWHHQAQPCKVKCYIRLRACGKNTATDLNILTDIETEPIFVWKIAISRLSSPHPWFLSLPLPNDLISDMRHQRGIVSFERYFPTSSLTAFWYFWPRISLADPGTGFPYLWWSNVIKSQHFMFTMHFQH